MLMKPVQGPDVWAFGSCAPLPLPLPMPTQARQSVFATNSTAYINETKVIFHSCIFNVYWGGASSHKGPPVSASGH